MNAKIAITGSLVDIKNVNMHKSARLTIDVPAELAASIVAAFGWPTMASPVPVAVARLEEPGPTKQQEAHHDTGRVKPPVPRRQEYAPSPAAEAAPAKLARPWDVLSYATQAGIRCGEPLFRSFVREQKGWGAESDGTTEEYVRVACDVESRRDIRHGTEAEKRWLALESEFSLWKAAEGVGAV